MTSSFPALEIVGAGDPEAQQVAEEGLGGSQRHSFGQPLPGYRVGIGFAGLAGGPIASVAV